LSEIVGLHHRMFVDPAYEASERRLPCVLGAAGSGQVRSTGSTSASEKAGREVWIEASYNPVFRRGSTAGTRSSRFATDITAQQAQELPKMRESSTRCHARRRSIEFTPDGHILTANDELPVRRSVIRSRRSSGKHHSMFCDRDYVEAARTYTAFWRRPASEVSLAADEFMRIGKGGRKVFIQASYNPIIDLNGKVFKVVKFASDVTARVRACRTNSRRCLHAIWPTETCRRRSSSRSFRRSTSCVTDYTAPRQPD
jgi:methyl-accepting chemotaxis protein